MPADPRPCVVITTYARPDGLARLLDDLERELPPGGLDVRVYDDATPSPDPAIAERLRARGWSYRRAAANYGKRGWWRWWNTILDDLRRSEAQRFYVLQDDMRLCERFFERSVGLWSGIDDPRKASLYLHVEESRAALGSRCWTAVPATPAGDVIRTGWVDCGAFMGERTLFDAIGWCLRPVPERRWARDASLSSGVGQQLSLRAHGQRLGLYRVARSLTVCDGGPSLMNAEARRRWSMRTVGFVDGDAAAQQRAVGRPRVFASLATIPRREHGLRHVVERLLPQVDRLGVFLNGHERVPAFLDHDEIDVARSQEHGDRGDAGKFFWAGSTSGYQLVCDDDLDYPDGYVTRLLEGIERHGRRAVVGFHGCLLHDEVTDYHRSRRTLHFTRGLASDTAVHVLGTGVAGYHASAIAVRPSDFASANMADVWLALLGQRQRVPFVCLAHDPEWLRDQPGFREDSLYTRAMRRPRAAGGGPGRETLAVREHRGWALHGAVRTANTPRRRLPQPRPHPPRAPEPALVHVRVQGPAREATLVLPDRDHITEVVRRSGTYYERDLLDAIREHGVTGTFVDVGAHYGNHTTFFGLECGATHVVAIEPSPAAHAGLLATVAANGLQRRVVAHRVAVHPEWRDVTVMALPWRSRPGATTSSNSGRVIVAPSSSTATVAAAPLDAILASVRDIGVVKVDAGRLSAEILSSGLNTLRRERPLVAAEAASPAEREALRAVLVPLAYREIEQRYCWTPTWLWEPCRRVQRSAT